jgi:hypothetical protein
MFAVTCQQHLRVSCAGAATRPIPVVNGQCRAPQSCREWPQQVFFENKFQARFAVWADARANHPIEFDFYLKVMPDGPY